MILVLVSELWPHPDSTVASPMTGSESTWRIAKPVTSEWRPKSLEANRQCRGWRLQAPRILSPQPLVSAACLAPEINPNGALVNPGTCLRSIYVLALRLALALPA